ncbi:MULTISPECIES: hypothetical protein [Rhodococcus]|uniref:Uncharacterized protein n=4 Tax=Rhodococcus TaxID=1827 RepID=A0AB38FFM9_RHOWR|nr:MULTISPECIES: hypothetical protein [Rhodococcus]EJI97613.1 putative membrane protein [Rhodococcus sp. JVH1]AII07504.1 membrane protein [Rhodococcus opacus]REE74958.1 hypothetical protein C8E05_4407 [Rhodococcus wratislaviensis]WAM11642.1 hypothetical protein OYT95_19460 [Rhodococcus sp. JS3073]SPZ40019.1 Uncharacterised protein [Rhodococcus wratislaviensis]
MANPAPRRPTDPEALYRVVAARRLQYENLLWQVPALSLTAQAFLFSIALGQGVDTWARIFSAVLALNLSVISIMLMASHRQAEIRDVQWLDRFEQDELGAGDWGPHGAAFRKPYETKLDAGWFGNLIHLRLMFYVWIVGLGIFGVVAISMIVRTILTTVL